MYKEDVAAVAEPRASMEAGSTENRHRRLNHCFEESCDAWPQRVALAFAQSRVSYSALDAAANQLAHFLRKRNINRLHRVGILLDRSMHTYVALLGVLKSGAAFVPLDISFPADRNAYIAQDAQLSMVVTTSDLLVKLQGLPCPTVVLDQVSDEVAQCPRHRVEDDPDCREDDLCYIIYTSGTTGRPKGVAVSHKSICNFLSVVREVYDYRSSDRVYQGMTISFDFAIEEIWPTFIAGATLVPGPTDSNRFGSGLTQFLIDREITVLCCVPTLLATIDQEVPTMRVLMVGGEACPQDLVVRWSRLGRRILNTYGPTETTVTSTWTELTPNRTVTIGRPLPTYYVQIIDPETRQLVAPGDSGEILIGGPGVAIGYVNREDLTKEKFIAGPCAQEHPGNGRMYRTGDLGRITADGEIEYLGRIDTQVKLRGYRIELSEIETILRECPEVENAVATPWPFKGIAQELAAYIKPRDPNCPVDIARLHETLCQRLPTYMVPAYIEVVNEVPTLPSGKSDRSRLPEPKSGRLGLINRKYVGPADPVESAIAEAWAEIFKVERVSVEDDFFLDLAGHSLFAAQVISALRRDKSMSNLSVGDLYANPTIRKLARHVEALASESGEVSCGEAGVSPRAQAQKVAQWPCGIAQGAAIYLLLALISLPMLLMVSMGRVSWVGGHWAWFLMEMLGAWVLILIVMAFLPLYIKWGVLGKAKAGVYPLWGTYFVRWWIAQKAMALAPVRLLVGTPLMNVYLRLLGAKIGPNCHLGTGMVAVPDMIEIGSGSSVGHGTMLWGYEVRGGMLRIGPVRIGADCYVGSNSILVQGSSMGDGARLGDQSLLACGQDVPAGANWSGSPAKPGKKDAAIESLASQAVLSTGKAADVLWMVVFGLGAIFLNMVPALAAIPGGAMMIAAVRSWGLGWMVASALPAGALYVVCICGLIAGLKRLLLANTKPGLYPVRSSFYVRKWAVDILMGMSLTALQALYATLYLPPWLRLLGAKIGRRTEISTVSHITPNLLQIGDESFVADAACTGPARVFQGHLMLAPTQIGRRSFLGNAAFMPGGSSLADNCLIGVLSVPPVAKADAGTSWLGSPAIFLPNRQASESFSEKETFAPTAALVAQRYVYEFFRIAVPPALWFAGGSLVAGALVAIMAMGSPWLAVPAFPVLYLLMAGVSAAVVVLAKAIFIGTYRPRVRPLWCHFTRRTELVTGLYENVTVPMLLSLLNGTPFMAPVLRALGAKIGRRVFLETTYMTEFDLVNVGDEAQVGPFASLQTHLFEDRVMKMSHVRVGDGSSIGPRGIVLYDSVMEDGASLEALSLLMKGESLPSGTRWWGSPSKLRSK